MAKDTAPAAKTAAGKTEQPKGNYTVLSALNHDLVDYAVGDTVELTAKQAEPLLGHTVKAAEA